MSFTHLDGRGNARMVDVTGKDPTQRRAEARCRVRAPSGGLAPLEGLSGPGLLETARLAGIRAAKLTSSLVPLCHPLSIGDVEVQVVLADGQVDIMATAETFGRTGVEMEALTACAVSALAVVGACDGHEAVVEDLTLWEKSGGRSGTWRRATAPGAMSRPTPEG
jgi:cyclic pyranopterin phosphate synthase